MDNKAIQEGFKKREIVKALKERQKKQTKTALKLLDHSSFKEPIRDAIFKIQRKMIKITPEEDEELEEPVFREYVRMPDGNWLPYSKVKGNDKLWSKIQENAIGSNPEALADCIIGHLNSTVNPNIATSKLEQRDINSIGKDSELSLIWKLKKRRDEFGINPEEAEYIVKAIVRPNVKAVLGKAKGGGFIKQILARMKMILSEDSEKEKEGSGILNRANKVIS